MPSSLAMHTMGSHESIPSDMATTMPCSKRVHFAPVFDETRRHSSQSLDSISESSSETEDWNQDSTTTTCSQCPTDGHEFDRDENHSTQTCRCGKLRHSDIRHAIPNGKTRRESVEGFDDVKRRWYLEWVSDQSAVIDEPWGFSEASLPTKFGVHHW